MPILIYLKSLESLVPGYHWNMESKIHRILSWIAVLLAIPLLKQGSSVFLPMGHSGHRFPPVPALVYGPSARRRTEQKDYQRPAQ